MMAKLFLCHYSIILLIICCQDYRKEKEKWMETVALEAVADDKNDKTEKND